METFYFEKFYKQDECKKFFSCFPYRKNLYYCFGVDDEEARYFGVFAFVNNTIVSADFDSRWMWQNLRTNQLNNETKEAIFKHINELRNLKWNNYRF